MYFVHNNLYITRQKISFHENARFGNSESNEEEFKILDERIFAKPIEEEDAAKNLETEKVPLGNVLASYRNLRENYEYRLRYVLMFFISSVSSLYLISDNVFGADDSFSANGEISSLVFGMPPSTNTVNMSSVEKFILSGNWKLVTDKGKITNFTSEFYTGPASGANNHTHQVTNLRVEGDRPVQLSPDGSILISGLTDVKTNGKSAWKDVPTTISISKGRTISINLADNGTQRHFMGQSIYGIINDMMRQQ